jgi:hypothetical protein
MAGGSLELGGNPLTIGGVDVVDDETARKYIQQLVLTGGGAVTLDGRIIPELRKDKKFAKFKNRDGGPNRAFILNFLTKPQSGFVVFSDSQNVWVLLTLPESWPMPKKTPEAKKKQRKAVASKKKPRRRK